LHKKKVITALIGASMLVSLTGCPSGGGNNNNPNNGPQNPSPSADVHVPLSPDTPVTFTAWITTGQQAPAPDNKISRLLREQLGVTIDYEIISPENQDQKIGVSLAGGQFPDLIGATDQNGRMTAGASMIKLDGWLATGNYPYLAEHVDPYLRRISWSGEGVDPGLYVIPNYNRFYGELKGGTHWGTGFWLQKAILVDAGYPSLDNMTLERYFGLIENYMAKNPTIDGQPTIGFQILASPGREWGMLNPPLFLEGQPNNGGVMVDHNNHATIYADKETARNYFKFLNEMNAKGLVDRESFTQTLDQYLAKIATGRVLGMHDQRWNFGNAHDSLVAAGLDERTYISAMPTWPGREPYYADRDVMNLNQGFGVSVSNRQVPATLSFLDKLLTEEWQKILSWGVEGEDYLKGPDGLFYRTPEQRANYNNLTWRANNRLEALRDIAPKRQGTFSDGNAYSPDEQPTEFYDTLTDFDKNIMQQYNKRTWREFVNQPPENPVWYPAWNIPIPDGSAAQMANRQLQDAAMQFVPRAILAAPSEFDAIWDSYVAEIARIDVAAYEDAINEGIQYRLANWQ